MFKGASENSQFRSNQREFRSTANVAGIDPTTFQSPHLDQIEEEYTNLVAKKQELQITKTQIKASIGLACAQRRSGGQSLSSVSWERLQRQNVSITLEMAEIDKKITDAKRSRKIALDEIERSKRLSSQNNFEFVFFSMAKEMLSGPVFDRITTATLHRLSQINEQ